jgi:hypothetical protein
MIPPSRLAKYNIWNRTPGVSVPARQKVVGRSRGRTVSRHYMRHPNMKRLSWMQRVVGRFWVMAPAVYRRRATDQLKLGYTYLPSSLDTCPDGTLDGRCQSGEPLQCARSAAMMSNTGHSWIAWAYQPDHDARVKSKPDNPVSTGCGEVSVWNVPVWGQAIPDYHVSMPSKLSATFIFFHLDLTKNSIWPCSFSKMQSTLVLFLIYAPYSLSVNDPYEEIAMEKTSQCLPYNSPLDIFLNL